MHPNSKREQSHRSPRRPREHRAARSRSRAGSRWEPLPGASTYSGLSYGEHMSQAPGYEERAKRRFDSMMLAVSKLNADNSRDPDFTNVLVGLAMELYRAFGELQSGMREQVTSRVALATRTLLELRYWTSFASASEENIWRLRRDSLVDARDMLDKFEAICAVREDLAPCRPIVDSARSRFAKECEERGITTQGNYIRVSKLAKDLGLDDEHRAMGAFLSKLVHPTGFSICLPDVNEFIYQQLYSVGCWYFNDSHERLNRLLTSLEMPALE
jgi:hypothetical protein